VLRAVLVQPTGAPSQGPIDLGALAEALLFYGSTSLVIDKGGLNQLLRHCGLAALHELVEGRHLILIYRPGINGVMNTNQGTPRERFDYVSARIERSGFMDVAPAIFEAVLHRRGRARRAAERLARHVVTIAPDDRILEACRETALDASLLDRMFRNFAATVAPDVPVLKNLRFEVERVSDGLIVHTNVDFAKLNASYVKRVPPEHSSISPAFFLAHIAAVRENLLLASERGADTGLSAPHAAVAAELLSGLLKRSASDQREIQRFQEFVFRDAVAVRAAINDGRVTLADILPVLDKARDWKAWLEKQPHDAQLLRQYYEAIVKETWLQKLPTKIARWSLFTGLGAVITGGPLGAALGVAVSGLDATLVERLATGWRPNQFIEGTLAPVLRQD
jgi:hypothetical protein